MKITGRTTAARRRLAGPLAAGLLALLSANCGDGEVGSQRAALLTVVGTTASYAASTTDVSLLAFGGSTGMVVPGTSFSPAVAFTSPESATPGAVLWSSDAISDAGSTRAPNSVGPIGGNFAAPVSAFSFDYLSGDLGTVVLYDSGGNALSIITPAAQTGFFGVLSSTPIAGFLAYGTLLDNAGSRNRIFLDNFRISTVDDGDSDGVPDGFDACPGTAAGAPVDAQGCSAAQLVALACPCAAPAAGGAWKNHGQYVSCVAHASQDQVTAGLLPAAEQGAIVSAAARSSCGK